MILETVSLALPLKQNFAVCGHETEEATYLILPKASRVLHIMVCVRERKLPVDVNVKCKFMILRYV